MEGAGMMAAAQRRAKPANTLVLRGISDLADERKSELDKIGGGGLRKLAMTNALDYLLALVDAGALWPAHSKSHSA
jgi:nucleoside phosphorylase